MLDLELSFLPSDHLSASEKERELNKLVEEIFEHIAGDDEVALRVSKNGTELIIAEVVRFISQFPIDVDVKARFEATSLLFDIKGTALTKDIHITYGYTGDKTRLKVSKDCQFHKFPYIPFYGSKLKQTVLNSIHNPCEAIQRTLNSRANPRLQIEASITSMGILIEENQTIARIKRSP